MAVIGTMSTEESQHTRPWPAMYAYCPVCGYAACGGHDAKPKPSKPTKYKTLAEILRPTRVEQLRRDDPPLATSRKTPALRRNRIVNTRARIARTF